jgi:hypothetical protein
VGIVNLMAGTVYLTDRYAEKTDIQLQVRSSAGTQEIGVFAEGILAKVPRTSVISG